MKIWSAKYSTLEQTYQGSANEYHFANNNEKCARNVKRTISTSNMALLPIESFAIAIRHR